MSEQIKLSEEQLARLAGEVVVAAGRKDTGEPAERMLYERLVGAEARVFSEDDWALLEERVGAPEDWLLDEVIPGFLELLDLQQEAAGDEELMERLDPFLGAQGELLLFLAVLKDRLALPGITLEAEGLQIPRRPSRDGG